MSTISVSLNTKQQVSTSSSQALNPLIELIEESIWDVFNGDVEGKPWKHLFQQMTLALNEENDPKKVYKLLKKASDKNRVFEMAVSVFDEALTDLVGSSDPDSDKFKKSVETKLGKFMSRVTPQFMALIIAHAKEEV